MTKQPTGGGAILLVEDEESLAAGLTYNLQAEGYSVVHARDGREAISHYAEGGFDLVVLDLMIPFIDGFEVARIIREEDPQLPILMLTARSSARDRVRGLEAGADDYLTKPFHLGEFLLRVRGMLRRKAWYRELTEIERYYRGESIEIDFGELVGKSGERRFTLTPLEASLLRYLIHHEGRLVSREELLERVWGVSGGVETRTVENFIVRLRRHLEEDPSKPRHIRTVRGAGYEFSSDVHGER